MVTKNKRKNTKKKEGRVRKRLNNSKGTTPSNKVLFGD